MLLTAEGGSSCVLAHLQLGVHQVRVTLYHVEDVDQARVCGSEYRHILRNSHKLVKQVYIFFAPTFDGSVKTANLERSFSLLMCGKNL